MCTGMDGWMGRGCVEDEDVSRMRMRMGMV